MDLTAPGSQEGAAPDPRAADDAAWAEVESRWADEEAHRAFLALHADLSRLAEAGRRYREVLERRPDDAVARRWRDEVLKRATVLAMAQLPRTRPPREVSPAVRRTVLVLLVVGLALATAWVVARFPRAG